MRHRTRSTLAVKRLVVLLMITVMISVLPLAASPAKAAVLSGSDNIVTFIKNYEGFRSTVYWNSGKTFIGYGTSCSPTDYPDGITKEKAEALLREALALKEQSLNKILAQYNVQLTQNQYDAFLDFTFNLGSAWMSSSNRIFVYLTTGLAKYSDIQIVNALATWCHVGTSVSDHLVERRIREAKILLYADYTGADPHEYRYLTYDAGAGDVDYSIEFFNYNGAYGTLQSPVRSGYTFTGWYTAGGTQITSLSLAQQNLDVTAGWMLSTAPQQSLPVQNGAFTDVSQTDWFFTYVSSLNTAGILSGYPDGTFRPANTVTCGEALKLILRTVGFDAQSSTGAHWASGYFNLAMTKAIVNDTTVTNLDAPITRRAIAEITAKALGLPALEPETVFQDTSDGFVLALYHMDIIKGSLDSGALKYYPNNYITRAEMSAVLSRIRSSSILQAG